MESSVKSLIQAEESAKAIVQQAEKEKNDKLREAKTNAEQLLNKERTLREAEYREEQAKVRDAAKDSETSRAGRAE